MAIMVAATGSGRERASMRIAGQQKGIVSMWTLYTGEEHCVGFIDRDGALCGLYTQGRNTVWAL